MGKNIGPVLDSDESTTGNKLSDTNASFKDAPFMLLTFVLVLVGWIFFRANTIGDALYIIKKIVSDFSLSGVSIFYPKRLVVVFCFIVVEWVQRHKEHPLKIDDYPSWARMIIYYLIIAIILLFGVYNYTPFIYFQF